MQTKVKVHLMITTNNVFENVSVTPEGSGTLYHHYQLENHPPSPSPPRPLPCLLCDPDSVVGEGSGSPSPLLVLQVLLTRQGPQLIRQLIPKIETLSSKEHLNSSVNHNLSPLPTPNLTIEQIKINNSRACLYDHSKWFFLYSLLKFHYFPKNWSPWVT